MNDSSFKSKMRNLGSSLKTTILIIGTAVLLLAAVRNSLTWHLTSMWGLSRNFWQNLWISVLELFNYNQFFLYVIGTSIMSNVPFWFYNFFLLYIDLTGKPEFLQAYKIQEEKTVPVDKAKVMKAVKVAIRNQLLSVVLLVVTFPLFQWRGIPTDENLPSFQRVLLELAGCIVVEEFGFYYAHRLLHHPKLYKHVHKVHHEWTAPIGIVGIYAHPIEHILSNFIPVMLGPTIMGAHLATIWLWIMMALLNTSNAHCGYHFPSFPSSEQHDFHHLKFNQCYGVLGILDRLHNTDNLFRASKNYQRHIMHFSLTPLKIAFPDEPKIRSEKCD